MASNADIKQHISTSERAKWNKIISDFDSHLGSTGTENHKLADGKNAGFSTCDFTTEFKAKLEGIQDGALNNPHPETHDVKMITGLHAIATSGSWNDIKDLPSSINKVIAGTYDALTVSGGIRITIGPSQPSNPVNNKELWIDTAELVFKVYTNSKWEKIGAAFR